MIVEVVEGAGIVAAYGAGWLRRARKASKRQKQPRPVCGCNHSLALHDPKTGACHSRDIYADPIKVYDKQSRFLGTESPPCRCRQYVGPKPVDSFFSSEVNWDVARMKTEEDS